MKNRINLIEVDVHKIFPNVWNPNRQSEFIFEKEIQSIKTHGVIAPVLVREIPEGFEIIDGEHRFKAAVQLGFDKIACNNLGAVTDSVAKQLTIIMNEVKGKPETAALSNLIKELSLEIDIKDLAVNLPYTDVELDTMVSQANIDWASLGKDPEGGGSGGSGGSLPGDEDWKTVSFRLPEGVADQLESQVLRYKKALHPDDDPKDVSPVQAIEAICQTLAQIEDEQLI